MQLNTSDKSERYAESREFLQNFCNNFKETLRFILINSLKMAKDGKNPSRIKFLEHQTNAQ